MGQEVSMVRYRAATSGDFKRIKSIALEGWLFSYSYLPSKKLVELVGEYYSESSLKSSLEKISIGTDFFIVAESGKKVIAFCHVATENKKGELLKLYVDKDYIGKGIGRKLLSKGEEFMKSKGLKKCFTFVNMHNKIGLDFYVKNGFVHMQEKDKEDEFRNGKVLWCMEKSL